MRERGGDLFADFMGFLPNLIGALLILAIGSAILILPVVLLHRWWKRKPDGRWRIARMVVAIVYWMWVVSAAVVLLGLAVDVLGITALQPATDWLAVFLPKVVVAILLVVVGGALLLGLASVGERAIAGLDADGRKAAGIFAWMLAWPLAAVVWTMAFDQAFGPIDLAFSIAALVSIPWIILLRHHHAGRCRNDSDVLTAVPPPPAAPPPTPPLPGTATPPALLPPPEQPTRPTRTANPAPPLPDEPTLPPPS